jgi:hypothetical protein
MAVANTLASYDMATIKLAISFIVQAPRGNIIRNFRVNYYCKLGYLKVLGKIVYNCKTV